MIAPTLLLAGVIYAASNRQADSLRFFTRFFDELKTYIGSCENHDDVDKTKIEKMLHTYNRDGIHFSDKPKERIREFADLQY